MSRWIVTSKYFQSMSSPVYLYYHRKSHKGERCINYSMGMSNLLLWKLLAILLLSPVQHYSLLLEMLISKLPPTQKSSLNPATKWSLCSQWASVNVRLSGTWKIRFNLLYMSWRDLSYLKPDCCSTSAVTYSSQQMLSRGMPEPLAFQQQLLYLYGALLLSLTLCWLCTLSLESPLILSSLFLSNHARQN